MEDGSFRGGQPVDLLLRGRDLLAPGLLAAGDDRRVAAVVATTVETGEAEAASAARPAARSRPARSSWRQAVISEPRAGRAVEARSSRAQPDGG
ncbi:hypothetical protein ACWG5P_14795 [Streptomyces prasinus]